MVRNGHVAADVVRRTRALFTQDTSDIRGHFYIEDVVCEVLSSLREDLQRNTITVRTSFVQGLSMVRADRVQIQQVVTNLVRNAIDAMIARADCRQLSISSRAPAPMLVEVEFCDHGSGLEDHERAFEPFYSTKTNGMGLGLPICRAIVEAHGGKLTAAALPAGGTAFRITVPAAPRHLHDQQT
jgi:signal transduction histidine kinase